MKKAAPTALLVAATALWGSTFVLVRDAIELYGFLSFLAVRFAIAAMALLPLAIKGLNRESFVVSGWIGLALAAGYLLQTWGLKYTSPTNSGLITGFIVVFTPLLDRWLFRAFIARVGYGLVAAALVGLFLLTGESPDEFRIGDILTLGCAAAFALHLALMSRYARRYDATAMTFSQMLISSVAFGVVALMTEPVAPPPPETWFALVITGVGASAISFLVLTYAQQRLSATRTAILLTMEPVFALIFGLWLAGDRLTLSQWIGATLILAAIISYETMTARRGATVI